MPDNNGGTRSSSSRKRSRSRSPLRGSRGNLNRAGGGGGNRSPPRRSFSDQHHHHRHNHSPPPRPGYLHKSSVGSSPSRRRRRSEERSGLSSTPRKNVIHHSRHHGNKRPSSPPSHGRPAPSFREDRKERTGKVGDNYRPRSDRDQDHRSRPHSRDNHATVRKTLVSERRRQDVSPGRRKTSNPSSGSTGAADRGGSSRSRDGVGSSSNNGTLGNHHHHHHHHHDSHHHKPGSSKTPPPPPPPAPSHRHHHNHNKQPSALDNRDNSSCSKRDHDSRSKSRSSSRSYSQSSSSLQQHEQRRDSRPKKPTSSSSKGTGGCSDNRSSGSSNRDNSCNRNSDKDKPRCLAITANNDVSNRHRKFSSTTAATSTKNSIFTHKRSPGLKRRSHLNHHPHVSTLNRRSGENAKGVKDLKPKWAPSSFRVGMSPRKRPKLDLKEGGHHPLKRLSGGKSSFSMAARIKQKALASSKGTNKLMGQPSSMKNTKLGGPSSRKSLAESKKARRVSGGAEFSNSAMSTTSTSSLSTTSIPTTAKVTLDELSGNNTADEYEELNKVDKWVRSAPDELYYDRQVDGRATATERTQTLCEKFESTLLAKSKVAREVAEHLGDAKMTELIQIENAQIAEQKLLKKLKKQHKGKSRGCCHHTNAAPTCCPLSSSSCKKDAGDTDSNTTSNTTSSVSSPSAPDVITASKTDGSSEESSSLMPSATEESNSEVPTGDSGEKTLSGEEGPSVQTEITPADVVPSSTTIVVMKEDIEEGELSDSEDEGQKVKGVKAPQKSVELITTKSEDNTSNSTPSPTPPLAPNESAAVKKETNSDGDSTPGAGKEPCVCTASSVNEDEAKKKEEAEKKVKKCKTKDCSSKKSRHSSGDSDDDDDDSSSSSDSSSEDEDGFTMTRSDTANRELERRKKHPRRLHDELWHNDPGLMNDGPVCRCSAKARRFGIRHGFYPGEDKIMGCDPFSNNKERLYHYRITISPPKNFLISTPTVINHDGHEYIFEGFSIFAHHKLDLTLPPCKVIRFNIKYDVFVEEEKFPESFCVRELLLFETYLFREILELVDLKYDWTEETGCSQFHLMPRFVRQLPDNGQEVLSMSRVLIHLLKGDRELVREEDLHKLYTVEQSEWQNFADRHKGTIVTKWGMKPCALRVDQIDRDISGQEVEQEDGIPFPLIVHFGIRPPQLSYAGNAGYQRAWRRYVKYRHLLSNMPKPSPQDKLKLLQKEMKLQAMRTASNMKRDVTVAISAKGFRTTGICCDLVQHAMLIPVLVAHLRFHKCLETLEGCMVYTFQNRYLLQLAMTHPSYRENFGTNPDHARNALTNCGIRQPEYGDRRIHYASTRKRGINTLINIMAKFGADHETESDITHNERLEFLGDAVVEFTTSIHLFHIFPDLEEGGLATYRAAIVQNQHLAVLAQTLNLDQYMLYAHGSDLCHDSELRHAMANCFEALMGALFLDGGIVAADRVFGSTLFGTDPILLNMWANYPKHPLQQEEPEGDRSWVKSHEVLQKLAEFEESIGVSFNHIRLLARAFTDRSLGYNNLTKGSNQRLEFLGDTVLQLISSEYLYRHFPDHHEGHLSLLRSSLVNNRTQSLVCEDLGMPQYAMRGDPKAEMKTKDKADLLEAFLGALYIDKGLKYCILFCQVCFFPRLSTSITKQEWNDPKSKLQQCCLTLRAMDGREPDIPVYKVTESLGPTNTRTYIVAVYFRGRRLATAQGHSIQEAEMNAAAEALEVSGHLFPQLHHQKRIMDKTKKIH